MALARRAAEQARKLFQQGKMQEGANLLAETADKIGENPAADQLRIPAIGALAFRFAQENKNREELLELTDRFLEKASDPFRELAHLHAASIYILCTEYGRAREVLHHYLDAYPPPTEEEVESFREMVKNASGNPDREVEVEHPRTSGRKAARWMLESISFIGKKAPPFEVETLGGEEVSPRKFEGKVLLLDFWATWCTPCIEELPRLKKTYEKYHPQGLEILGLSLDQHRKELAAFVEAEGITWRQAHVQEKARELLWLYKFEGIPATFLIDRRGIVRARDLRGSRLTAEIGRLIEEEPPEGENH